MTYRIVVAALAQNDIVDMRAWITAEAGSEIAGDYVDRIDAKLRTLAEFPHRGTPTPSSASACGRFRSNGGASLFTA